MKRGSIPSLEELQNWHQRKLLDHAYHCGGNIYFDLIKKTYFQVHFVEDAISDPIALTPEQTVYVVEHGRLPNELRPITRTWPAPEPEAEPPPKPKPPSKPKPPPKPKWEPKPAPEDRVTVWVDPKPFEPEPYYRQHIYPTSSELNRTTRPRSFWGSSSLVTGAHCVLDNFEELASFETDWLLDDLYEDFWEPSEYRRPHWCPSVATASRRLWEKRRRQKLQRIEEEDEDDAPSDSNA